MLIYPNIDPVAISIGPLQIHWYGLMYLLAFASAWGLGLLRARKGGWNSAQVGDLIFYIALGTIVGGRLGYVLFYGFEQLLSDPLSLFRIWEGGMSFHGGLIGVGVAMWVFAKRTKKPFFVVTDFLAPLVPLGLGFGRIGNFINAELWGRVTEVPWGMIFPQAGPLPRHPSMLYEAILEGGLLFIVLWIYSAKPRPLMSVSGLFLLGYGVIRIFIEFFRVPDAHIGYLGFGWLTMGQVLSLPMVIVGIILIALAYRHSLKETN